MTAFWRKPWDFEQRGFVSLEALRTLKSGETMDIESIRLLAHYTAPSPEELFIRLQEYFPMNFAEQTWNSLADMEMAGLTNAKEIKAVIGDTMSLNAVKEFLAHKLGITVQDTFTMAKEQGLMNEGPISQPQAKTLIASCTYQRDESNTPTVDPSAGPLPGTSIVLTQALYDVLHQQMQWHQERLVSSAYLLLNVMDREPGDAFDNQPIDPDRLPEALATAENLDGYVAIREWENGGFVAAPHGMKLVSEKQYDLLKGCSDRIVESMAVIKALHEVRFVPHKSRVELFEQAHLNAQERARKRADDAMKAKRSRQTNARELGRQLADEMPF